MQHLQPATTLRDGDYKIVKLLGQGGFGITYLAEQTKLNRTVAIKEFFMKELCNRDEETSHVSVGSVGSIEFVDRFKKKFLKEAELIGSMNHPHIVKIFDIFEENGTAYYTMENIEGGSLADRVKNGAFEENDALHVIKEVASALDYIHQKDVLHLDIKPSNILLRNNGEAVLIDFGISKHYDRQGEQTSTTPIGVSKGYTPIEQYNQGVQKFYPATDVYSLGATLYNLLTAQTPPEATVHLNQPELPYRPAKSSQYVWEAIEKAMQPIKNNRYQTVAEFMQAISAAPAPQPVPSPAPQPKVPTEIPDTEVTVVLPSKTPNNKPTIKPSPTTTDDNEEVGTIKPWLMWVAMMGVCLWLACISDDEKFPIVTELFGNGPLRFLGWFGVVFFGIGGVFRLFSKKGGKK